MNARNGTQITETQRSYKPKLTNGKEFNAKLARRGEAQRRKEQQRQRESPSTHSPP